MPTDEDFRCPSAGCSGSPWISGTLNCGTTQSPTTTTTSTSTTTTSTTTTKTFESESWVLGPQGSGDCHATCSNANAVCDERMGQLAASDSENVEFEGIDCEVVNNWVYGQGFSQCTDATCCGDGSCQYHCSVMSSWPGCIIEDGFAQGDHSRICPCTRSSTTTTTDTPTGPTTTASTTSTSTPTKNTTMTALDIFFEEFGNGAANGGRDHFNVEYVEAVTTAIEAEDLFHAGLYKEANDAVKNLWEKHPTGSNVWDWNNRNMRPKIQGFSETHPYALLRMVEDMSSFQLTADHVPASPKKQMVITVVLAEMETILPTSWNDFSSEDGTMKENVGVSKTILFDEKMLDGDYKIIHENLKTWIAYIENVAVQGHIDFQVKVVKTVEPLYCSIRLKENENTGKFDLREFKTECDERNLLSKLPNNVIGDSHWFMLVHPHYAKELRGFEDFQSFDPHTDDKSMEGIHFFDYFPLYVMFETNWLQTYIEDLSGGLRDLSEVERRLWWARWTMHEMFHYLLGILYKNEGLEDEYHQWFDTTKWPQDFVGQWESDYFHEAMHKRFLKAPTLPSEKILHAVGIGQEGRAKSSSWYGDVYFPVFAIDGKISTTFEYFFHSARENYPWFQLWIPEGNVTGVTIVPRYDYDTQRFQNIEFRAGMTTVVDGFKGRLTINEKVGFFTGPAVPGENYTITFDTTVLAKYITIQRMQESSVLEINEVTLL